MLAIPFAILGLQATQPAPQAAPPPAAQATTALAAARPCSDAEFAELIAPGDAPYRLTCRAMLDGQSVTRRLIVEGAEASGATLDCGGGSLGVPGRRTTTAAPTVAILSRREGEAASPRWSRPSDVMISNCVVHGAIRIWGMGANGRIEDLHASSRTADHTRKAQDAAPTRIALNGLTFLGTGSIPLYVGPGATRVSVLGGRFGGRSDSTAVYLDAESAGIALRDIAFDIVTAREQIAVDGSARNRITGNRFALRGRGGVFLYRNCGEDGVIRHQTPSDNVISDNRFSGANRLRPQTVVVGAREGNRRYCDDDRGFPFGSSADDGDHAERNVVERNRIIR